MGSRPLLWMLAGLAALLLGCDGDGGGAVGETDDDDDEDIDAGDTESDTGEDCGPQEIEHPVTGDNWKRCHLGGDWKWDGDECDCVGGTIATMTWDEAAEACPGGWRMPTAEEMLGLLDDCPTWEAIEDAGMGTCTNCPGSDVCSEIFPGDGQMYWTGTEHGSSQAYSAWFNVGTISPRSKGTTYYVRCIEQ